MSTPFGPKERISYRDLTGTQTARGSHAPRGARWKRAGTAGARGGPRGSPAGISEVEGFLSAAVARVGLGGAGVDGRALRI